MLVGFDASRAFVNEATGTENYSKNLLLALAEIDSKNKYRVYVRHQEDIRSKNSFPSNFEFVMIKPNRLWTQGGLALETWKNPVDVLFVPAHTLPVFKNPKVKTVVTIHDLGVEYLPQYHKFPQRYYLDFASKFAAATAGAIIAVSAATKHDLEYRYKVAPQRVFVVHEGVDTGFFKPASKEEVKFQKSKFKIKGKYILFVGTIQPRKNLEMLIRAFSKIVAKDQILKTRKKQEESMSRESSMTNLSLVIAGKLGWGYQPILDLPKKLGIEDKVKFLGYVDREDLPTLYSGATAFAFPSLFEGFGLPILEALACGCPVIVSDIEVHREISKEFKNSNKHTAITLAKVNKVDEWTRFLYHSITLNNKISEFASIRAQLASKFSWLAAAKSTLAVFEHVIR